LREGVRRYVEWESERRRAAVPARRRVPVRSVLTPPLARVAVVAAGVLAGVLAAVLARYDQVSDGAGLLGLMALVGLPLALIARIDWARDRRRAAVVGVAMLAGAALASLIVSVAETVQQVVRHHAGLFVVVAVVMVVAGGYATRPAPENG
jgi:peptidoglycan/LPS O-acetylase OafA/YrhL